MIIMIILFTQNIILFQRNIYFVPTKWYSGGNIIFFFMNIYLLVKLCVCVFIYILISLFISLFTYLLFIYQS